MTRLVYWLEPSRSEEGPAHNPLVNSPSTPRKPYIKTRKKTLGGAAGCSLLEAGPRGGRRAPPAAINQSGGWMGGWGAIPESKSRSPHALHTPHPLLQPLSPPASLILRCFRSSPALTWHATHTPGPRPHGHAPLTRTLPVVPITHRHGCPEIVRSWRLRPKSSRRPTQGALPSAAAAAAAASADAARGGRALASDASPPGPTTSASRFRSARSRRKVRKN